MDNGDGGGRRGVGMNPLELSSNRGELSWNLFKIKIPKKNLFLKNKQI